MHDAAMFTLGWVGLTAAVGIVGAVLARGRVRWVAFAAALVLMAAYDLVLTRAYGHIPFTPWPSDWNWGGKILALILSLTVASLPMLGWRRTGLTLMQDHRGLGGALAVSGLVAALFLGLAVALPGEGFDADSLAFQLTMPGLDEELFFRGVLLLVLNAAFVPRARVLGADMGWGAVVSSVAFGLMHALGHGDAGYTFEPVLMASTGTAALLLVWLKEKTGSLLLPVLLHNFGNVIFMVV